MSDVKLHVDNLTVSFKTTQGMVRAVRGVTFDLFEGETLAIVGESGSGKSVSIRTIMGILAGNGVIDDGKIIYEGEDLTKVDEEHFHEIRGNRIGMIFQDPMSSLNPIMRIGKQITEGMLLNGKRLENKRKAMFQNERANVISIQREIKTLKKEYKASKKLVKDGDTSINLDAQKAEMDQQIAGLKAKLPAAKSALKAAKAKANAAIKLEWDTEKARVDAEIAKVNAQMAGASADEALKLKEEIENLKENLKRYKAVTKKEAFERAIEVMTEVGIDSPEKRFTQYPFQFSGGMRQRIVIAIALANDAEILICDEPTTALDVTIQAQILELINRIKEERNLTIIFITHDLGVVANMADRVAVMYAGQIIEYGNVDEIYYDPRHPYTWALLAAMPDLDTDDKLFAIAGTPPDLHFPPVGDAFAPRNHFAMEIDFEQEPPMFQISDTHFAKTWLEHEYAPKVEKPASVTRRIERHNKLMKENN
jgi:oligopeptide transport system ATP-binding protein